MRFIALILTASLISAFDKIASNRYLRYGLRCGVYSKEEWPNVPLYITESAEQLCSDRVHENGDTSWNSSAELFKPLIEKEIYGTPSQ